MQNLELLEELVAFKKYGTLSAVAEHLMITQPTVTRKMKKLESDLGVDLFDRHVSNHIVLNDTGQLAAREAEKVLAAVDSFTQMVTNYDRTRHHLTVGSVAPGPLMFLEHLHLPQSIAIDHQLIKSEDVANELLTRQKSLIFTDQELDNPALESMFLGVERLGVGISQFNPLSQRKQVSFSDLAGLDFLVVEDIGPWRKIVEDNIPDGTFLYQDNLQSMSQISRYSNFPFFFSNLTQPTQSTAERFANHNRNRLKLVDKNNRLEIYGSYLKENRATIQPVLKEFAKQWPK